MKLDEFARGIAREAIYQFRQLGQLRFDSLDHVAEQAIAETIRPERQKAVLRGEGRKAT